MGKNPSLIAYPIFRLTISMVAGFFLFDQFLTGYAALWSGGASLSLFTGIICCALFFLFLCLFSIHLIHPKISTKHNAVCGVLISLIFMLFGGIRLTQERERVDYSWSKDNCFYWGELATPPVAKGKTYQAEVHVETKGRTTPVDRTILLYWMPDSLQQLPACGDKILFYSEVSQPVSNEEITGFDYPNYLYRKGISGTAMAYKGDWKIYKRTESLGIKQWALSFRDYIVNCYRRWNFSPDEFAVVSALTIGDKSVLTSSLKEVYSAAGVSHVLALSGLHIGILSAILFFLFTPLKRIRHGETIQSLLVVLALWAFAFISGLSPSVVRAVTMCSLYFLATCFMEERFSGIYTLVLAAFIMLIYQPFYLFDLSCQLSFLAVASILYFYPVISGWLTCKNKLLRWLWNSIAVSISAQFGTLPLILYYFGTFPTYFLLANLIVGVLAVCVLCGAIVALLTLSIPYVNSVTVWFLNISTLSLNQSVRWVHQLTGSQIEMLTISVLQAVCGFCFLYFLYQYIKRRKPNYFICMLAAVNITLVEWVYRPYAYETSTIYLNNSHVYLKQQGIVEELTSSNHIYNVDTLQIGVLTDDSWSHHQASHLIPLDYLYLSKGFKGNLKSLSRVFSIRQIIFDTSLSEHYLEFLKKECLEMKIPYTDLSEKGSFRILL